MRFALDMCYALDMPCGALGIYIAHIAKQYIASKAYIAFATQIYRAAKRHIAKIYVELTIKA